MVVGMFVQGVATTGYVVVLVAPFPEGWFVLARVCWGLGSALVLATAFAFLASGAAYLLIPHTVGCNFLERASWGGEM